MARIRTIKPEFWQSEKVGRLSPIARLVFIGLISHADDEGRGRGGVQFLRSTLFPYGPHNATRRLPQYLQEISTQKLAVFYSSEDGCAYYWVPGFCDNQYIQKRSKSDLPPPPNSGSPIVPLPVGREGKGKEGKGREEPPPPPIEDTEKLFPNADKIDVKFLPLASPELLLVKRWNRSRGQPISEVKGVEKVRMAIKRGAKPADIEAAFMNSELCDSRKIWEVLEPLEKPQPVNGTRRAPYQTGGPDYVVDNDDRKRPR